MYYISDMLKFGHIKICFVLFQTTIMDGGNYFCQEIGVKNMPFIDPWNQPPQLTENILTTEVGVHVYHVQMTKCNCLTIWIEILYFLMFDISLTLSDDVLLCDSMFI